ncbi:dual specificity protein phosphatase 10-like [Mytilus trossulus]|uniref:dual specificity protein phosphatase 10-like n=1 Tax=Mytilus trossulus TaxID=6551 RepID=UPI0030079CCC
MYIPSIPMPESGELEVLPPPSVTSEIVSGRRRVALQLDFDFTCGKTDDFHHLPKRCRLDSMNYSISGSALKQQNTNTESLKARTIQPQELDTKLRKSKSMLLVDCRPFVSYNIAHINGALNVNCSDRFNRKRLQQGKATIVDLVTSRDGKDMFKRRGSKDIILYDDHTKDIHQLSPETSMHIVLASLLREGREAYILKGGIEEFRTQCSDDHINTQESRPLYSPTTPIIEPQIETATASEILPFLYLGNERDASNLQRLRELNISHILNITSNIPKYFENQGIKYKRLPASDSGCQNLRQYFDEAIQFIDEARADGGKILVHCQAGVSRSATATIAYILKHSKMNVMEAYRHVKNKRVIIAPNFNFMGQLMEFEQCLNQGQVQRILQPNIPEIECDV